MCRAAAPAFIVLLVLLGVLEAGCHSGSSVERLPRPQDPPQTDPAARASFLDLVNRASHTIWWVDSTFVRTTGGKALRSQITEVNRPPDHVVVGVGGATGSLRGTTLSCSPATGGPVCTGASGPAVVSDPTGLARLTDVAAGWYSLRRSPARMVAGLAAQCFRMDWNSRATAQPYGPRATLCYSGEGIPVSRDVDRPASSDRIVARSVQRAVTDAAFDALVAPYTGVGPVRPVAPGPGVVPAVPPIGS
jgi:hypothetical protein